MNIKRLGRQLSLKYAADLETDGPVTQRSLHLEHETPVPQGQKNKDPQVDMVPFTREMGIAHVPTERETRHSLRGPMYGIESLHPLKAKLINILQELGGMGVVQPHYVKQMAAGIQDVPLTKLGPFYNEILDALDAAEKHALTHLEAVQQLKNKL